MILSKTTTYAIRILIFMANHPNKEVNSSILFDELNIPKKYLQRILTSLSKNDFIAGSRGRSGGFVFVKKPETIFLSEIVDTFETMSEFNICIMGTEDCRLHNKCIMHESWEESRNLLVKSLTEKRLTDFKEKLPNI